MKGVLLVGLGTCLGVAAERRTEESKMLWEFHVVEENTSNSVNAPGQVGLEADNNLRAAYAASHAGASELPAHQTPMGSPGPFISKATIQGNGPAAIKPKPLLTPPDFVLTKGSA